MRIVSSLVADNVAIDRTITDSTMDKINAIHSNLDSITLVGTPEVLANIDSIADENLGELIPLFEEFVNTHVMELDQTLAHLENLSMRVVETLPPGSEASMELVGDEIQLRIPAGHNGSDGVNGVDGYTPVKGVDYVDGIDGYTPVKGVDYTDGESGKDGRDGSTPKMGFTYNQTTGDIDFEVVEYLSSPEIVTEWE